MKNALALTAIASSLFLAAPLACADEYVTLSNYRDSIELKKGETALIVSVSGHLVVQYDKKNTWPVRSSQFTLSARKPEHGVTFTTNRRGRTSYVPTWREPFPLSGPCKIQLMTSGVMGMRVLKAD